MAKRRKIGRGLRLSVVGGAVCAWCQWPAVPGPEDGPEYAMAIRRFVEAGEAWRIPLRNQLQVDHIVPVHLGGTNHQGNLRPLCSRCNRVKGRRSDDEIGGRDAVLSRRRAMAERFIRLSGAAR